MHPIKLEPGFYWVRHIRGGWTVGQYEPYVPDRPGEPATHATPYPWFLTGSDEVYGWDELSTVDTTPIPTPGAPVRLDTPSEEVMRREYHWWLLSSQGTTQLGDLNRQMPDGTYEFTSLENMWRTWQAAVRWREQHEADKACPTTTTINPDTVPGGGPPGYLTNYQPTSPTGDPAEHFLGGSTTGPPWAPPRYAVDPDAPDPLQALPDGSGIVLVALVCVLVALGIVALGITISVWIDLS